jgi:hypothetical protein
MASPRPAAVITRWFTPQDLLSSPTLRATAWVSRYSTSAPDVKEDRIETGHGLGRLAVSRDAIWVTNAASRTVARIDRRSGQVNRLAELRRTPAAIGVGNEAIWVVCANGWLWRLLPSGDGEGVARLEDRARGLACDRESVWVLHASGRLVGVDQATGETNMEAKIRRGGHQLLYADGALVALSADGSRVLRVAPDSGETEAEVRLAARGVRAVLDDGTVWVACGRRLASRWGTLVPIDLATMATGAPRELPNAPRAITAGAGHLWVACGRRGEKKSSVVRVEPGSGRVAPWAETEWTVYDLAVAGDQLLAATGLALAGPAAAMADGAAGAGHHGGHHGGGGEGGGGGN